MSFEKFINQELTGWMVAEGEHADIVLSTRIRLARNLQDHLFPVCASQEDAAAVDEAVHQAVSKMRDQHFTGTAMVDLTPLQRQILVEKHLVSPQLIDPEKHGSVLLSEDETISIMVNEEDHIRIQCIYPGFQIDEAYELADRVDSEMEKNIDYAFDETFGYLTSCPSNTGTGMRASVMMHLPALTITKQIERIIPAISRLGMVVRGSYGEGSEALGNIYQISNQITLGKSEEEILKDLKSISARLIAHERKSRELLLAKSEVHLENRLFRSLGTLTHARILPSAEAAKCLSDVRLGIDLNIIENIDMSVLNELMIFMQPGYLQQYAGTELTSDERDILRAQLFRDRLKIERSAEPDGDQELS
ncbi:protein arginine kinase [Sporosarcina sp. P37]|uniref:protein arginine kinase n=1 Tax=unclassified Sporosarcina TaxID=2647733 RepID=UPI0009BE49DF|nr:MULTISPECIES: protein arginine kinase [unclassified Sporosarcina]ARD48177.1 ATP--guanido phosphotransferase [Sporosarcina sp. P33]ARK24693.1 protein arginine kinase [Sporosarcina sp. P37]PID19850.1 protein arginine kinase [Sporosarcina sp. P35]